MSTTVNQLQLLVAVSEALKNSAEEIYIVVPPEIEPCCPVAHIEKEIPEWRSKGKRRKRLQR